MPVSPPPLLELERSAACDSDAHDTAKHPDSTGMAASEDAEGWVWLPQDVATTVGSWPAVVQSAAVLAIAAFLGETFKFVGPIGPYNAPLALGFAVLIYLRSLCS